MTSLPEVPKAGAWSTSPPHSNAAAPESSQADAAARPDINAGLGNGLSDGGWPAPAAGATIKQVKAPEGLLYASLASAAVGLLLAAVSESIVLAVIGWVLAALVGLGLATAFVVRNASRQASPWYLYTARPLILYRASVVVCLLAVVAASVRIALFVGRM